MGTNPAEAQYHLRQAVDHEFKATGECLRTSKYRRNALVPISHLPPETLTVIFTFLSHSACDEKGSYMAWLHVTHVCHHWRETALNCSYLWNHINFTKLSQAGITEIVARAKMSPLHLEAKITNWSKARFDAFAKQLEAHISHTRQLTVSGDLRTLPDRLVSPAPALEFLSLSDPRPYFDFGPLPDTLFNSTAPNLTSLELHGFGISRKMPLKGLRTLKITKSSRRMTLKDWLDALDEMPQLETFVLHDANLEEGYHDDPLISARRRTVTLHSLTQFNISASATDCALAFVHLVFPALTSLHVTAESNHEDGEDVLALIPCVARNANGPQDTAPLQSMLVRGESMRAAILAWTVPDADLEVPSLTTTLSTAVSARLVFSARGDGWLRDVTSTMVLDSILIQLPVNAISTLTAQSSYARLTEEFWLRHVPRLAMLKQARLAPTAIKAFKQMLVGDVSPNSPRWLPQLTKLVLVGVSLTAVRTYHLRDMLVKRREQGAPLEALDLRTCIAAEHAIELFAEAVGNVRGPAITPGPGNPEFCDWRGGVDFFDEEEDYVGFSNDEDEEKGEEYEYVDEADIPFGLDDHDSDYGYYYEYYSL